MTDHRSVLVISTVISSSTFAFLVIMLPLMFINVQQRKSFMLQSVNLCRSEVLDIRERQAKEFRSESLELKGRRLPRGGYAGYQSQPISALFYNSCCSCKQGPPGLPGKRALPGKNGRPGELGMLGRDGKAGAYINAQQIAEESCQLCPPSVRGPPGTPGLKGPLGPAGASGLPGIPGISGEKGIRGPVGSNGKPGNAGPQGPIGDPGRTIFSAPPGKSGQSGLPGPRGAPGSAGFDGQSGERGLQGPRGYQGDRGPPGPPGQLGPRGPTGLFGTLGETKLANSKMPSQTPKQKAEITTIGTEAAPLRIYASKTFKSQNRGTPYLRRRDRI